MQEFFEFSKSIMKYSLIGGLIPTSIGLFFDAILILAGVRDMSDVLFHLSFLVTILGMGLAISLFLFWWVKHFKLDEAESTEDSAD